MTNYPAGAAIIKVLLQTIERETRPIDGHQDPNALNDCWRSVYGIIEEMQIKSNKYDALLAKIDKCYEMDDNGEFVDKNCDLGTIGEITASHFGYL